MSENILNLPYKYISNGGKNIFYPKYILKLNPNYISKWDQFQLTRAVLRGSLWPQKKFRI